MRTPFVMSGNVARVLADGADSRVSAHMRVLDRQAEGDAARRVQVNLRRRDSGQQQHSRRLRGRRRVTSRVVQPRRSALPPR